MAFRTPSNDDTLDLRIQGSFISQGNIADAEARREACRILIVISIQFVAKLRRPVSIAIEGTVAFRERAKKAVEEK